MNNPPTSDFDIRPQYDPQWTIDPEFRFHHNLLAERINEQSAILAVAHRADPEFRSEQVRVELKCASAFLHAGQFAMAAQSCEQAECYFLAERSRRRRRSREAA